MTDLSLNALLPDMIRVTEADRQAHDKWASNGTVDIDYVLRVLGDPAKTFIPGLPPVRFITEDQMLEMECPFPPERGYE